MLKPKRTWRTWHIIGALLVISGGAVLGYVLWLTFVTDAVAGHNQPPVVKRFREEFHPQPKVVARPPHTGGVYGVLSIPSLSVTVPIIQGVGAGQLSKGVGHFPTSHAIGEPGNLAFAGHRTTWGHPFGDVDELEAGDLIKVQSSTQIVTYKVVKVFVVKPNRMDLVSDRNLPAKWTLTLTTCNPKYSARERLIVRAVRV